MGKVRLSLVVLKTLQMDAMRSFYSSIGIELIEEQHGDGPIHYAGNVGNLVLEIYPLNERMNTPDSTSRLGFIVENLDDVIQCLRTNDTRIVREPQSTPWGIRAVVRDPDGRTVELYQQ